MADQLSVSKGVVLASVLLDTVARTARSKINAVAMNTNRNASLDNWQGHLEIVNVNAKKDMLENNARLQNPATSRNNSMINVWTVGR